MKFDINRITRESIKKVQPYSTARDEFEGNASVYLDANENPFHSDYNRYPDPHQKVLKKVIADQKKINVDQILLGNGSDEVIDLLFRAFCEPRVDNVIIPQPTYGMYSVSAQVNDIAVIPVPLTSSFQLNVNEVLGNINPHTKLIFLCSPNNPSGNLLIEEDVIALITSFSGLVILDEAYIDFADCKGFLPKLTDYPNLVILQTFSKAWGLAGIRLGTCFATSEIIQVLSKIKPPYNINTLTQEVALSYLKQADQKDQWVKAIIYERTRLVEALGKLKCITFVFPSDANFILVKVSDARKVYQHLLTQGIIVRDRSNVILCEECLRITIGTATENKTLIESLTTYEKSLIH